MVSVCASAEREEGNANEKRCSFQYVDFAWLKCCRAPRRGAQHPQGNPRGSCPIERPYGPPRAAAAGRGGPPRARRSAARVEEELALHPASAVRAFARHCQLSTTCWA